MDLLSPDKGTLMQFWRYDVEEALCWMNEVWWSPTSRPVLLVVVGVTAGITVLARLAAML